MGETWLLKAGGIAGRKRVLLGFLVSSGRNNLATVDALGLNKADDVGSRTVLCIVDTCEAVFQAALETAASVECSAEQGDLPMATIHQF